AGELEDALGGVYSVLAEELQKPLVELMIHHKARQGLLPPLPEGLARPEIVTGLDALGRGRELARLEAFMGLVGKIGSLSQTPLAAQLDLGRMLRMGAEALGVAAEDLVKPPVEEALREGLQEAIGDAFEDPEALGALASQAAPALQALLGSQLGAGGLTGLIGAAEGRASLAKRAP
ncbi:MAG: portal protein, partial [Pseudomonadota bacterium]